MTRRPVAIATGLLSFTGCGVFATDGDAFKPRRTAFPGRPRSVSATTEWKPHPMRKSPSFLPPAQRPAVRPARGNAPGMWIDLFLRAEGLAIPDVRRVSRNERPPRGGFGRLDGARTRAFSPDWRMTGPLGRKRGAWTTSALVMHEFCREGIRTGGRCRSTVAQPPANF